MKGALAVSDHLGGAEQNIAVPVEDDEACALSETILGCASNALQLCVCDRHGSGASERAPASLKPCPGPARQAGPCRACSCNTNWLGAARRSGADRGCSNVVTNTK